MDERVRRFRPMRTPIDQINRKAELCSPMKIERYTLMTKEDPLLRTLRQIEECSNNHERIHCPDYKIISKTEQDEKKRIQEEKIQQEVNEIIYLGPTSDWAYDDDLRIKKEVEQIMNDLDNQLFGV